MHQNHFVRTVQAAGGAFSILFKGGAGGAVDSIIPTLLHGLDGNAKQSSQVRPAASAWFS